MLMTAASMLEGMVIKGWEVDSKQYNSDGSGGNFSVGYELIGPEGQSGFLKALDFERIFLSMNLDPSTSLEVATRAFNHEREILKRCSEEGLSRVIRYLGDGTLVVNEAQGSNKTVQYLIFEYAQSNVRRELSLNNQLDWLWVMSCLHHVAVGLSQLHRIRVAHQDVKPSNILLTKVGFKLGDLGRSSVPDIEADHDGEDVAGDPSYKPIEAMYGYMPQDFSARRVACDLYQFGSLAYYLVAQTPLTANLINTLADDHRPASWSGSYDQVLPYLERAFSMQLEHLSGLIEEGYKENFCSLIRYLCAPDPMKRGYPSNITGSGNQYNLERFVSLTARLKLKAEINIKVVLNG